MVQASLKALHRPGFCRDSCFSTSLKQVQQSRLWTREMHVVNESVSITVRNIFFFKVHGVKKVYEGLAMKGSAPSPIFFPLQFLDPFLFWSKGTSLSLGHQTAETA